MTRLIGYIVLLQNPKNFFTVDIVIDNNLNLRHVEAGFQGHFNDAQCYDTMAIGNRQHLDIPRSCYILGDCIYPSTHPIVTPYTAAQLRRQNPHQRRQSHTVTWGLEEGGYMWNM